MTLVDQIIQIANEFPADKARPLIQHLIDRPVARGPWQTLPLPKMQDKKRNKPVELQKMGDFIAPDGRAATVYKGPPTLADWREQRTQQLTKEQIRKIEDDANAMTRKLIAELSKDPWATGS